MNAIRKSLMIIVLLLLMISAASAIHEIIPSETQVPLPGPNAEALNEYIVRFNPYRAWNLWPGKERLYKGREPHGALLTTFVNTSAFFSVKDKQPMTDGAIIVKENYTADKKFVALTVMYKIKGYDPAHNDWFWAKYTPDGKPEASGKVKVCIDCHGSVKGNDYLFTGPIK